ncbi:MAG: hypothetical protein V9E94_17305, partial [Microthrixaceae bacterium]
SGGVAGGLGGRTDRGRRPGAVLGPRPPGTRPRVPSATTAPWSCGGRTRSGGSLPGRRAVVYRDLPTTQGALEVVVGGGIVSPRP